MSASLEVRARSEVGQFGLAQLDDERIPNGSDHQHWDTSSGSKVGKITRIRVQPREPIVTVERTPTPHGSAMQDAEQLYRQSGSGCVDRQGHVCIGKSGHVIARNRPAPQPIPGGAPWL